MLRGMDAYLGPVGIDPVVVWIVGESLLDSVYCAVDVGFGHARDLDRHIEFVSTRFGSWMVMKLIIARRVNLGDTKV
jgi:hypothetical protein